MKRTIGVFLALTMILGSFCAFSVSVSAASPVENIYINGEPLSFSDAERPYISNERTMVPLRAISEALGATVYWFNDKKQIQIVRYDTTLRMFIGIKNLEIWKIKYEDGAYDQSMESTVELDAPPFQGDETRDYRTFVPLRAISEAFGADVNAAFADKDETKTDRPINVYILDTYDESTENNVSIAELYDKSDIQDKTLIATVGIITKIDDSYYLQDEEETYKMISFTDIPDVENFWTEQLGVKNNDPVGTKVKITGMVAKEGDKYTMQLKRGSTGIRTIELADSNAATGE